jgi:hypothetical protein
MKTEQRCWSHEEGWSDITTPGTLKDAQLVLLFGHPSNLKNESLFKEVRQFYPQAYILSGSTAGEILNTRVYDDSLVATAIQFENTVLKPAHLKIEDRKDSFSIGEKLVKTLEPEGLRHVFVLVDGLSVNGSELVKGMVKYLPEGVGITGGLTADGGGIQGDSGWCQSDARK